MKQRKKTSDLWWIAGGLTGATGIGIATIWATKQSNKSASSASSSGSGTSTSGGGSSSSTSGSSSNGSGSSNSGSSSSSSGSGSSSSSSTGSPATVQGLAASVSNGVVSVRWHAVSGATHYPVSVGQAVHQVSGTTDTISGLTAGQAYTVSVVACNAHGCSTTPATTHVSIPKTSFRTTSGSSSQNYGESLSGTISPSQAWADYKAGKLAGPGWVLNGQWFQNVDQIPASERSAAGVNSAELSSGTSASGEGGQSSYIYDLQHGGITSSSQVSGSQQGAYAAEYQKLGIIPSTAQTSTASRETSAEQAGLQKLKASGASANAQENYLVQLYGYSPSIAKQTVQG